MNAYCDIIAQPRPVSRRHPQMRRADRAKQFMPFAALRGFEDTISERETLSEPFRAQSANHCADEKISAYFDHCI